jgi:hypothetical protein
MDLLVWGGAVDLPPLVGCLMPADHKYAPALKYSEWNLFIALPLSLPYLLFR